MHDDSVRLTREELSGNGRHPLNWSGTMNQFTFLFAERVSMGELNSNSLKQNHV